MTDWTLAIDFGTTYTTAAMAWDGRTELVEINGQLRMSSAALVKPDGELIVGAAAENQAVLTPERYEPTPKRRVGQGAVLLGSRLVQVSALVASILRTVADEARRRRGGTEPSAVYLTHPATWASTKKQVLRDACEEAGLGEATLVAEPVAAAMHFATRFTIEPGRHIAVYDLGGGTFDAAVLRRVPDGFEVAGAPGGIDPLGGEDFDAKLFEHVGKGRLGDQPEIWAKLQDPPDSTWRRHSRDLRAAVKRAKETLSTNAVYDVFIPGAEVDVQVTKTELEALVRSDVQRTVDEFRATIHRSGLTVAELDGVYLAGDSSRMPLVSEMLWGELEIEPRLLDDPKGSVALGAAGQLSHSTPLWPAPQPAPSPTTVPPDVVYPPKDTPDVIDPTPVPKRRWIPWGAGIGLLAAAVIVVIVLFSRKPDPVPNILGSTTSNSPSPTPSDTPTPSLTSPSTPNFYQALVRQIPVAIRPCSPYSSGLTPAPLASASCQGTRSDGQSVPVNFYSYGSLTDLQMAFDSRKGAGSGNCATQETGNGPWTDPTGVIRGLVTCGLSRTDGELFWWTNTSSNVLGFIGKNDGNYNEVLALWRCAAAGNC